MNFFLMSNMKVKMLWLTAIIFWFFGDLYSTYLFLSVGIQEANPFFQWVSINDFWFLVVWKTILLIVVFGLWLMVVKAFHQALRRNEVKINYLSFYRFSAYYFLPLLLSIRGITVTIHNLSW